MRMKLFERWCKEMFRHEAQKANSLGLIEDDDAKRS